MVHYAASVVPTTPAKTSTSLVTQLADMAVGKTPLPFGRPTAGGRIEIIVTRLTFVIR